MTRETSIEAYHTIKERGLLSRKRLEVYEILFLKGPYTANQISKRLQMGGPWGGNVHARLNELKKCGVVKELGVTECPVTKMTVILWDVTAELPRKYVEYDTRMHIWVDPSILGTLFVSETKVEGWHEFIRKRSDKNL